nr:MAG TPA: RNA polymerase sigma factor [Caudoviricetes sp.]
MRLLLNSEWDSIRNKAIIPLWKFTYGKKYKSCKLDYEDFESMAGYELSKALPYYDESKSSLVTFARNIISKKANSELKNCIGTDKRAALYSADTLDVPVSKDRDTLKINAVPAQQMEDHSDINKIRKYLTKLSATEKDVVIFRLIGFDTDDIVDTLGITKKRYADAIKSMQIYEKASLLRKRG